MGHVNQSNFRQIKIVEILWDARGPLQEQLESHQYADLGFEERLGLITNREITDRENERLKNRLVVAIIRQQACLENLDYSR